MSGSLAKRLLAALRDPRRLRRALLRRLPGVVHVGSRATVRRPSFRTRPRLRKSFGDDAAARGALARELEARAVFADLPWLVPIRDRGEGWIELPALPGESRLDRAAGSLSGDERREVARQLVRALFDVFCAGFAHCDVQCGNLYWWQGRLLLADFEKLTPYPPGTRPAFSASYDLVGRGLEPPSTTPPMFWDATKPARAAPGAVLGFPAAEAVALLASDLEALLAAGSRRFSSRGSQHRTRAGLVYSSFRLPGLEVPASEAQRDSARRLERFGLVEGSLAGRSLLDLGCNVGCMLFESQRLGPRSSHGIERDPEKVELARQVAAFCGLRDVSFESADLDELDPAALGRFDAVYCLAVVAHLQKPGRLFDVLRRVTAGVLFFEGNGITDPEEVQRELSRAGFRAVEYLGRCDDDRLAENNRRPLFLAAAPDLGEISPRDWLAGRG